MSWRRARCSSCAGCDRSNSGSVADRLVADVPAAEQPVVAAILPADKHGRPTVAAPDRAATEVDVDLVGAAAGVDEVGAVAGVDEVLARAAVDAVHLRGRLAGRLVVAPEHVAGAPGADDVVAVPAQQLVVP